uniref:Uncharacterized protein n=3 Tax=Wuchereria bancrofti TaxID=6293 RepID=A0A1I8ELH7_WUCBA
MKLTRMTAAIAMIMIMSTVLCSGKKKSSKKRKDFNFARKTLISSETKEEVKKDAPKNELKGKENLLASNYPTGENLKKMHDDMKRKKAHNNAPLIQLRGIGSHVDGSGQLADPDDKEAFYPPVTEPTPSIKRKREEELEKDKEKKIREGFYQSRSDEDDTLEPIKSLKDEETDPADKSNASKKIKRVKSASHRASESKKLKT